VGAEPAASRAVGVGLKPQHLPSILRAPSGLDFFEVHAENYMGAGGPFPAHLERVRRDHALSIHGVGLSIGGEGGLDVGHLGRLAALAARFQPQWVSEHLAWSSHGGVCFNDLLPLPYNAQSLDRVCRHVEQVQDRLQRRLLLENPATYLEFESSSYGEAEFLCEVVRRTGCGLLLDLNNAFVNAVNHRRDAAAFIAALPAAAVGEIHLAGFSEDRDAAGARLLIDSHGTAIDEAVWQLYAFTLQRLGPRPTLVERDNDVPDFATLRAEALRAAAMMDGVVAGHAGGIDGRGQLSDVGNAEGFSGAGSVAGADGAARDSAAQTGVAA
jgi:uncharacterized protein (UPF0276 family)